MTLVEDVAGASAPACQRVLDALEISVPGQEGYLRLLDDPSTLLPPAVIAELADAHLISAESQEPLPLRLATQVWSARREAEMATVVEAALTVSETLVRRPRESYLEVLQGLPAVVDAFTGLQRSARTLIRTLDRPPYLSDGGPAVATEQAPSVARGVHHRTIYLASNLHDEHLRGVIAESMEMGEEARIEHDLPMRMSIADDQRALLILPQPTDTADARRSIQAVLVHPSALLDGLIRMFESTWAHSLPLCALGSDDLDQDRRLLSMLSSGMTDARIAHAIGVSERTVARRVASLQERLQAPSRFVLGVRAAQAGLI